MKLFKQLLNGSQFRSSGRVLGGSAGGAVGVVLGQTYGRDGSPISPAIAEVIPVG